MEITLNMRPPRWPVRRWRRRLGLPLPTGYASTGPRSAVWVCLLVPYRARRLHHWYAQLGGFFWLPCPVCGHEFGGHESGGRTPRDESGRGNVICSRCTRADKAS